VIPQRAARICCNEDSSERHSESSATNRNEDSEKGKRLDTFWGEFIGLLAI
jgi:hypothetical protein